MSRLMLATCMAFVLVGCDSNAKSHPEIDVEPVLISSKPAIHDDSSVPDWQLIDSNEWYDLFELTLTDTDSLISTAFHKTDAQLGIGIAFNIAILADDRGFKYFTTKEGSPSDEQMEALRPLLPESRVLESHSLVKFSTTEPEDSDHHVFDAEFMTQMQRNQGDEFE